MFTFERERDTERKWWGEAAEREREGDTESEAGSESVLTVQSLTRGLNP